jgi:hypothetical protein
VGAIISLPKSYWHEKYGLIAEIHMDHGFPIPFLPLSVLVAPPGGSKGHVTWDTQATAFGRDPTRPNLKVMKFLYRLSPYWYNWMLAFRMGIPIAAPVGLGGIDIPIKPKVSSTHHAQWLRYLSQASTEDLIKGLGLSPVGTSQSPLLREASKGWLKEVLKTHQDYLKFSDGLLSPCSVDDETRARISLADAYIQAVGSLRSVEFYFRAPREFSDHRAPSVRRAAQKFQRKVMTAKPDTKVTGYANTALDLQRKTSLFFTASGGMLPDPWVKPQYGFYGIEPSERVAVRYRAPNLLGMG